MKTCNRNRAGPSHFVKILLALHRRCVADRELIHLPFMKKSSSGIANLGDSALDLGLL